MNMNMEYRQLTKYKYGWGGDSGISGISGICLLGLSASVLAGGVAKLLQPLPGPGQQANQSIEAYT